MKKTSYSSRTKEKIKVCHIITKMVYGGASLGTLYLAAHINPEFFQSYIICGSWSKNEGNLLNIVKNEDVEIIVIPEMVREINLIKEVIAFVKLIHIIKKHNYDIIHTHGGRVSAMARLAAAFCRVPIILYTVHGWSLKAGLSFAFLFRLIERILAMITDKFLFQTKSDLNEAIFYKIGKPSQYVIIGNGIVLERFLKCDKNEIRLIKKELKLENRKIVGTVGRASTAKNPKGFINIACEIFKKRKDTTFVFVGGGELLQGMKNLVKKMGLDKQIIFTGVREDVPQLISFFDVFILPSLWEGMPRSVIEAMALSKPVVVHDVSGIDEIVRHKINGLIVPMNHTVEFAENINSLLDHPEIGRKMGDKGKKVAMHYDFNKVVEETEKLYLQITLEKA